MDGIGGGPPTRELACSCVRHFLAGPARAARAAQPPPCFAQNARHLAERGPPPPSPLPPPPGHTRQPPSTILMPSLIVASLVGLLSVVAEAWRPTGGTIGRRISVPRRTMARARRVAADVTTTFADKTFEGVYPSGGADAFEKVSAADHPSVHAGTHACVGHCHHPLCSPDTERPRPLGRSQGAVLPVLGLCRRRVRRFGRDGGRVSHA